MRETAMQRQKTSSWLNIGSNFNTMTWVLIPVAIAINIAIGQIVVLAGAVHVPTPVEELDKADAFLHEPTRLQTIVRERSFARFRAIHVADVFRFLADVEHLGHGDLHAVGKFVLLDTRLCLRIA